MTGGVRGRSVLIRPILALVLSAICASLLPVATVAAATSQAITFTLPAMGTLDDSFDMTGTADSGLPVSYVSSDPAICSVTEIHLSLDALGTCTVTASQPGDDTYDPALDVSASIEIVPAGHAQQTIAFTLPSNGVVGGTVPLAATADSGLEVTFAGATPSTCSISDGTTLHLDSIGTCTVTASQPGNDLWDAAPDVDASIAVKSAPVTTPGGASLGRYAFNAGIVAMTVDPSTGIAYVAGGFTQVGLRTGSVAIVNPPGSGSDALRSMSPDVIAGQARVFADDATGFFLVGAIGSINGDGVQRQPVVRMTSAGTRDTSWTLHSRCDDGSGFSWLGADPRWDLGPWLAAPAETSGTRHGRSTVGLELIDKATGEAVLTGDGDDGCSPSGRRWASIGPLPFLVSCQGWAVCSASALRAIVDAPSHTLIVEMSAIARPTASGTEGPRDYLVAYDMTAGTRLWVRELEDPTPPPGYPSNAAWGAYISHMTSLGDAILLSGSFPLESSTSTIARTLLLDRTTGAILQRWSEGGEQDPTDPTVITHPLTTCTYGIPSTSNGTFEYVNIDATTTIGYGGGVGDATVEDVAVCEYGLSGSGADPRLTAIDRGTFHVHADSNLQFILPSTLYADRYLVGGFDAYDLQTDQAVTGWHPSPSDGMTLSTTVMGTSIVFGGEFTFLHGTAANHVAALDPDLTPLPGFHSSLVDTANDGNAIQSPRDLAILGDQLLVAGYLHGSFGHAPVVALDLASGETEWVGGQTTVPYGLAIAADPASDTFYVGFEGTTANVVKYRRAGDGFEPDPGWSHTFSALDGQGPFATGVALQNGRLYVGGIFSAIDGEARQGLARFDADGSLDPWAPALVDAIHPPANAVPELYGHDFLELGDRVVVSGHLWYQKPSTGGSVALTASPVAIFSTTTGALIRPKPVTAAWFPTTWYDGYVLEHVGDTIYVALGNDGYAAFDDTTFDFLPSRSVLTQTGWGNNAIYALAARPQPLAAANHQDAVTPDETMLLGGSLTTWEHRTAGDVVEIVAADVVKPVVVAHAPVTSATKVPRNNNVTVRFSEIVTGGTTGVTLWDTTTGKKVSTVATWTALNRAVTLNPKSLLVAGRRYKVKVASTIADRWGNHLAASAWIFTVTTDHTRPRITHRSPASGATGVSRTANVVVTFSESVKVSATTIRLRDVTTGAYVSAVVTLSSTKKVATLDPAGTLSASHQYTVVVSGVTDLAGNPITKTSWTFKTRA